MTADGATPESERADEPGRQSPSQPSVLPFQLQEFSSVPAADEPTAMPATAGVELDVRIELGRTEICRQDVPKLRRGSIVPLDNSRGEPVDVIIDGRLVVRGEVLVLHERFCVRVTQLLAADDYFGLPAAA